MNKESGKINIFILLGILAILVMAGVLTYQTFFSYKELLKGEEFSPQEATSSGEETSINPATSENNNKNTIIMTGRALEDKNILMVIAFKNFQDEEYFMSRQLFIVAGADVKTASNEKGTAVGVEGGAVLIDTLINEADLNAFDAVVFIGGGGALEYLDNEDSYKLARETIKQDKVLAAICIAPVILAKAGVLENKEVTVWSSSLDKSAIKTLEDNGAIFKEEAVVADGKIITGSGPEVVDGFGMKVVEVLAFQ